MRKKTHEEYVKELAVKNPNIEVAGKYNGINIKILHHCLIHNVFLDIKPLSALNGVGCKLCYSERLKQSKLFTEKEYIEKLHNINPYIDVLEPYVDIKTHIKHLCKKHDVIWSPTPNNVLKGCGCPKCGKEKVGEKNKKTHEQYVDELKIKNPNIKVLDTYKGANISILHKCLIDGYEWIARPSNILSNKGCPKCSNCVKRSHEQYVNEVAIVNSDIEVIGQYINMKEPILHICKKHNIQWKTSPSIIMQGCGCPECGKEKLRKQQTKTHNQYINELKDINPNITVIGTYKGANTSILHKCLIDGNEWHSTPGNILFGNGCPQCNESKGERKIRLWLDNHNIIYETQKSFRHCRDKKPLPFDFYLPNKRTAIEFDGEQHYKAINHFGGIKAFEIRQKHDNIKNEYCKNNGISLLRIPYFKNIEEELNNFLFI